MLDLHGDDDQVHHHMASAAEQAHDIWWSILRLQGQQMHVLAAARPACLSDMNPASS